MENLRNLFRIGLLSFLVGCCSGVTGHEASKPVVVAIDKEKPKKVEVEKLQHLTVAIVTKPNSSIIASCAGVWVHKNLILTAAHCIDEGSPLIEYSTIDDYDKDRSRYALLLAVDAKDDLALLIINPTDVPVHPIAHINSDAVSAGDDAHVVGHTSGYAWTYSKGHVAAIRLNTVNPSGNYIEKTLQVSAPIWMGNSGGGAFDADGNLIGMCSWISKNGPNLSFFIHKDVIKSFIIRELSSL